MRCGFGVKISAAITDTPIAGFDKAGALTVEPRTGAFVFDLGGDVARHNLGMSVREHAGLRQRLADGERNTGSRPRLALLKAVDNSAKDSSLRSCTVPAIAE